MSTRPPRMSAGGAGVLALAPVLSPTLGAELSAIRSLEGQLEALRREVMERIVRAHGEALLRFCVSRVGRREAAEEVVQEIFTQVESHLSRVEGEEHLRNLLYRLAKHRCSEVAEAGRRELALRHRAPPVDDDEDDDLPDETQREMLRRAIASLPKAEDRMLLMLSMDLRLPLKQIATVLGISPGACKMRGHRARQKLKQVLVELAGE